MLTELLASVSVSPASKMQFIPSPASCCVGAARRNLIGKKLHSKSPLMAKIPCQHNTLLYCVFQAPATLHFFSIQRLIHFKSQC